MGHRECGGGVLTGGSGIMKRWARLKYQPNLPLEEGKGRVTESPAHRSLSMEAAKEGMVLLKNEGNVLPLKKGAGIALLGCRDGIL